jgi:carbonic anhydrase
MSKKQVIEPKEALDRLLEGNRRFVEGAHTHTERTAADYRSTLLAGQEPFAAVLACADSRTPPEHIFDAGLGELFVCRNAGNLLNLSTLGSMEFAVTHAGCPLAMVMGHSSCGALTAAVAAAKAPEEYLSHNIDEIVRRLWPSVLATKPETNDESKWVDDAAKKNVLRMYEEMLRQSPIIDARVKSGEMGVVGAWYDLSTGYVEVLKTTL